MDFNDNNTILLNKLQDNQKLQNKLIEFASNIKKYYRYSAWIFYAINNGKKCNNIILLRNKNLNYKIFSKDIVSEYNNIKKIDKDI